MIINVFYINKVNLGIEVLRMFLCFWVISFHYSGNINMNKYKIITQYYHVPTFMLISFYLTYKIFAKKNVVKIKQRLERLIIPYTIIPAIYLVIVLLSNSEKNIKKLIINLILQYIKGTKFYLILWFIQILLIYTIFFEIIFLLFGKNSLFIFQTIAIISYWSQYNLKIYNLIIYKNFVKMIPFAVTGLNLGSLKLLNKLIKFKIKSIFFSIIIFYLITNYRIFSGCPGCGIKINIVSICLFISFSLIPFYNIKNRFIINVIRTITRYSGGIYYFQKIIYYILYKIKFLKHQSFIKCIIIYILGYFICMFGTILFKL